MIDFYHDPRTNLACNTDCPKYYAGTCNYWPFPESAKKWEMQPMSDCPRVREVFGDLL